MSDHCISIVPRLSSYPNKEKKAGEILARLVTLNVIHPESTYCTLGNGFGYAIALGAKKIIREPGYLPIEHDVNGMEIVTDRQVFHTGENGLDELICPNCKHDIASEDWDFISEWSNQISNNITCPLCNVSSDIHQYKFVPEWGFSDLGFSFWNWPELTDGFINEFKKQLGAEVNVVRAWI